MRIYISKIGVKWKNSRVLKIMFLGREARSMKPSKKNKSWMRMRMNTDMHKKIKITLVDGMIWFLELNAFSESHSIVSLAENVLLPKVEDCRIFYLLFISCPFFIIYSCHVFLSVDSFFFCWVLYSHFIWFFFFFFFLLHLLLFLIYRNSFFWHLFVYNLFVAFNHFL